MTVKEFFKSNAFKSLAVLICIVLVAGLLLAIFNDLLYISDEERRSRWNWRRMKKNILTAL